MFWFDVFAVPKKFTVALIKPDVVENGQVDEIIAKVCEFNSLSFNDFN